MIYCDTSVLLSLYTGDDLVGEVTPWFEGIDQPVIWTDLHALEFASGLEARVGRGYTPRGHASLIANRMQQEISTERFFQKQTVSWAKAFKLARELAERWTEKTLARSLDVLHVANASLLEANQFWSLDKRQLDLAKCTGMKVNPDV